MAAALPGRVAVADLEGLEREVADHRRGDPGASELAGDLAGHELDRLDGLEARFEAFERRDAVRVGGLDGELGGLHEAAPVVAEALQALLGGELGQRRRGGGVPAVLVVGAARGLEQVDFHHALIRALLPLDAEQVLDGVRCRPEGARDAHAVLDCRLPGRGAAVHRAFGALNLDAGDGLEGLEVVRAVVGLRAAGGEEGAKLLIGKAAVADEVFDRVGGRGLERAAGAPGTEVAQPAGELVEQRVAGGDAPASLVAVRQPDRARAVVGLEREGDERRPADPVDAVGAVVEAFDMRVAVHREARGGGVQAALPQVRLAQLGERVAGGAGQVFGVDGETEVFVPSLLRLALGAPALGLQQLADVLELAAHVAGKVLVGGHDVRRVVGVGDDEVAQALEGGLDVGLHEVGEEVDIDLAARVDRDGERVRRVADVLGRGRLGGDEALPEDVGLAGHLAVGVHLLEAEQVEGQRVVREPLGGEHGEVLLGVDAAEALEERVVFGGQLGDGLLDLVVVRGGVALEREERAGAVAEREHRAGALRAGLAAAGGEGLHGVFRAVPDRAVRGDGELELRGLGRRDRDSGVLLRRGHLDRAALVDAVAQQVGDAHAEGVGAALEADAERRAHGPADDRHGADGAAGMLVEVSVDVDGVLEGRGLDPLGKLVLGKRDGLGAAAQQQDVAQRLGSRLAPERLGGQAHRSQELGLLGQRAAGRGRVLVERVAAGEHRDDAAGADRLDALLDEIVVDRHAVDLDVAAVGHVADRGVEGCGGDPALLEACGGDVRLGAERLRDARRDRIELHAVEVQGEVGGRQAHEVAGAAARLEDRRGRVALADADLAQRVVDGADDGRRRVEGGEDGMALGCELVLAQQFLEPVADLDPLALGLLGEGLLGAAPAGIGLHGGDLLGRGAASLLGGGKRLECRQVLPGSGDGAARALRAHARGGVDGLRDVRGICRGGGPVDGRRDRDPGGLYMASMISLIAISVAIASAEFAFLMKLGRSLERSSVVAPHDFMQPGVSSLIRLRYAISICSR